MLNWTDVSIFIDMYRKIDPTFKFYKISLEETGFDKHFCGGDVDFMDICKECNGAVLE